MRLSSVRYLFGQGMNNISKNKMMTFASFCVLMVSLLLVGISVLASLNINKLVGGVEGKNEIIVYIKENTSDADIKTMGDTLKSMDNISQVDFYSKEQALEDMKKSMDQRYQILFDSLEDDTLVDSYRIKAKDVDYINDTVSKINMLQNILSVSAPYEFASVLTEMKRTLSIISTAIIIALTVVSIVIISNTTRTSVFARRKEISIMKYVGATNAFIRIPFFVEGLFTGILSGIAATIVTWLAYDSLLDTLAEKAKDILSALGTNGLISFGDIAFKVSASYILAGAVLGAIGSVICTRKHLKV